MEGRDKDKTEGERSRRGMRGEDRKVEDKDSVDGVKELDRTR